MSEITKLFKELYSICLPFLCPRRITFFFPLNVPVVQFLFLYGMHICLITKRISKNTVLFVLVAGNCLIGAAVINVGFGCFDFANLSEVHTDYGPSSASYKGLDIRLRFQHCY